ncbi:MAG: hypothetical protein ACRDLS_01660 [Solirubrobacteraceae bacterium]
MTHKVFAGVAALGAALLVAAEFSPVYEVVVGSLAIPRREVDGADNHSYALLIVAVLALPMALGALRGARPAALALVALGGTALFVALALDLPDARATGRLPESVAYEDARARASTGLYVELAGGGLLIIAGAGLLARPSSTRANPQRTP